MGGLGVRSIAGVAKAALLRQVWNVILNRQTCWNIWVNARYLKNDSFWDVACPKSASWTDPWLPGGWLKDWFGSRAMYDLGLGEDFRVSTFIVHGVWNLPPPTSAALP